MRHQTGGRDVKWKEVRVVSGSCCISPACTATAWGPKRAVEVISSVRHFQPFWGECGRTKCRVAQKVKPTLSLPYRVIKSNTFHSPPPLLQGTTMRELRMALFPILHVVIIRDSVCCLKKIVPQEKSMKKDSMIVLKKENRNVA